MRIRYSATASRALRRSNKRVLITRKIKELALDPSRFGSNIKPLKGRNDNRLRVQDWRVIFRFEGEVLWIDEIVPRGNAYED